MFKLRHNVNTQTCILVYNALFYSHLSYGCTIWSLTTDSKLDSIRKLQKISARAITFSDCRSHSKPLFRRLNILSIDDVVDSNLIKLIFQFKNGFLPSDLNDLFKLCKDNHTHRTRNVSHNRLNIPSINTSDHGIKSLKFIAPSKWNEYSKKIPQIDDVDSYFRLNILLKDYFLSRY